MLDDLRHFIGPSFDYIFVGALISIAVIAGLVLQYFILKVIRKFSKKSDKTSESIVAKHLRWPLRFAGPLLFIFSLFLIFRLPEIPQDARIADDMAAVAQPVFLILFIVLFAWLIVKTISIVSEYVEQKLRRIHDESIRTRKIFTQVQIIKRVASIGIAFLAIAVALLQFKEISNLGTTLLASAGVIGIIVGFAAQRSIATLFAGFQIAFSQPIRIDDVVVVENEWGRIEEITLTYVVVRLWDQRRLILPITYFMEKPFQNWTRSATDLFGTVFIHTDYSVPAEALRARCREIVSANPCWDRKVCEVHMTDAKERSVEFRCLISAADAADLWKLRCEVREALVAWLAETYPASLPKVRADIAAASTPGTNKERNTQTEPIVRRSRRARGNAAESVNKRKNSTS